MLNLENDCPQNWKTKNYKTSVQEGVEVKKCDRS